MEDIFEKEMQKDTVFADRNVLSPHHTPRDLPHREKEIKHLMETLAPALKNKRIHNIFLYGKTGVGKTASVRHVLERLMDVKEKYKASIDSVYTNCRTVNSKYQIMLKCAEYCAPDESFIGYPFSHLVEQVMKKVESDSLNMIVVLDELDKVKDLDDLIYTLTRSNDELKNGYITVIGITNNLTFKENLDPRSRSTLCEEEMIFTPYNAAQLQEILQKRIEKGYKKNTVDKSSVNLAAALAAQESGDARYALKLILKAGEIADREETKKITDNYVYRARKGVEEDIIMETINTLPEHQKIVLYSIAMLTSGSGHYTRLGEQKSKKEGEGKLLFSGEVYEKYRSVCKRFGKSPRSARWCREYISDLEMLGLLTTKLSGKGVRGTTTLVTLQFPAEQITGPLDKHFK